MIPHLSQEYLMNRLAADGLLKPRQPIQPGYTAVPQSIQAPPAAAPPFWPGAMPQMPAPITPGINPSVPIPGINVSGPGMVTGANQSAPQPQTRMQKIVRLLKSPEMGAYFAHMGASLGQPRQPGESTMQQITRALTSGYGGLQGERQRQQQQAIMNWQMGQQEREQTRKESETAAQAETARQNAATNERRAGTEEKHVIGSLEQGKQELKLKGDIAKSEAEDRKALRDIQLAAEKGQWDRHADLMDVERRKVDVMEGELKAAIERKATQQEIDKLHMEVLRAQARHAGLAAQAELSKLAATNKDPIMQQKLSMASRMAVERMDNFAKDPANIGKVPPVHQFAAETADAASLIYDRMSGGKTPPPPAATKIRVKLSNGKTGTINANEFDAKTMTKLE